MEEFYVVFGYDGGALFDSDLMGWRQWRSCRGGLDCCDV